MRLPADGLYTPGEELVDIKGKQQQVESFKWKIRKARDIFWKFVVGTIFKAPRKGPMRL